MRRITAAWLMLALAGCAGGSGTDPGDARLPDPGPSDVPMLQDAVMLEPGGPDFAADDPGSPDTPSSPDAGQDPASADVSPTPDAQPDLDREDSAATPDLPQADAAAPDASYDDPGTPPETLGPDTVPPGDAFDPGPSAGDLQPGDSLGGLLCGPDREPCDSGFTCVTDSDMNSYCAPISECSGKGAIDIEELVALLLLGEGEIHVKVMAMAWPGQPACTPLPCEKDHPCCNSCFAPLFIGAEAFPIVLNGEGLAFGCQGTECDVLDACRPLLPSLWYWVWGKAGIRGGHAQLTVEGFCPADLAFAGF